MPVQAAMAMTEAHAVGYNTAARHPRAPILRPDDRTILAALRNAGFIAQRGRVGRRNSACIVTCLAKDGNCPHSFNSGAARGPEHGITRFISDIFGASIASLAS